MKKCIKCGNFIPDDANICPFCGADLRQTDFNQQKQSYDYQGDYQSGFQDLSSQNYQQGYQSYPNYQPYQGYPNQGYQNPQQFPIYQQNQQNLQNQQNYQQPPVNTNYTFTKTDNLPKILGFSSIGLGVIACPANLLAICGIFFSVLALALGIWGFFKSQEQSDKIINGIGIGISLLMLALSCTNSIFGVFMYLNKF